MSKTTDVLLPAITVHGRFQPPLHENHRDYILTGFEQAKHVTLLITNPFNDESFDATASWRNDPANNPFTFDERKFMFDEFFKAVGITQDRYTIIPFNIKDPDSFKILDPSVPNLVNVYSEWSEKKVDLFKDQGLTVIKLAQPKRIPVSGTLIREMITTHHGTKGELKDKLIQAGFVPDAIPGLLSVLSTRLSN